MDLDLGMEEFAHFRPGMGEFDDLEFLDQSKSNKKIYSPKINKFTINTVIYTTREKPISSLNLTGSILV